jgi:predicted TIM-barrel fold metal-dependent hydrolase
VNACIDCAVRPYVAAVDEIRPYLPTAWRDVRLSFPWRTRYPLPVEKDAVDDPCSPAAAARVLLEEGEAEFAVLVPPTMGLQPDPELGGAVAAAVNDWLAVHWLDEPAAGGRFRGSIRIDPRSIGRSIAEIERWADDPRFVQVAVPLRSHLPYGDARYWPVWEAAAEHGLPIAIDADPGGAGVEHPPTMTGWPATFAEYATIEPWNGAGHVATFICHGAFERIPGLVVVVVGGAFDTAATLLWRLDKEWLQGRVEIPWVERRPTDYLADHVRYVLHVADGPRSAVAFSELVDLTESAGLLMFGSRYPGWEYEPSSAALARLRDEIREPIMRGNAAQTYRMA